MNELTTEVREPESTHAIHTWPARSPASRMRIRKRDGSLEYADATRIVRAVERCSGGLNAVDPLRVATKTIRGLYDGATTAELDQLSIQTSASLIAEEPEYSKLAARLLSGYLEKEVQSQGIFSFSDSIRVGHGQGLVANHVLNTVAFYADELDAAIEPERSNRFEYFGLRTVYDRYLLRHPATRLPIETPQHFFLRVACGLAHTAEEAVEFYRLISSLEYLPSSPTLFNSGTQHAQMSSCYLLDSPEDDLAGIYDRYKDVALLSKFAGGIGIAYHRVRSRGSLIRGTNGQSNGIVPWLKTLDASVAAVNQGGKRKGAACVYLECWHADIEEFLELRDNTGDEARRTHNLNLAVWVPDLFMRRVEEDSTWSLLDPKELPHLSDLYGEDFARAYLRAEAEGRFVRRVAARDLYGRMMRTLAQTGNGWLTFKDTANRTCNQTGRPGNVVHLSNLCTEIIEVTSPSETAVCNLGSINLGAFVSLDGVLDLQRLDRVVRTAVRYLDRVIDINYYPIDSAGASNARWRPIGLGIMGLQDVFFRLRLPFDDPRAREVSTQLQEQIYFSALSESCSLAEQYGTHPAYDETRASQGALQFDLWGVLPSPNHDWESLRQRIREHGLRNSLLLAIAPTATIASIAGCYECIEPQVSNLFKRETLSGEFLQVNRYLVAELKARGLWNDGMRDAIKAAEGSVQDIPEVPEDLKSIYKTAWELSMRALIDMAAARGPFVDQSQSLNLFVETPSIGKLSSMYMYAWKRGLKTTYYLRSRPATRIRQTTAITSAYGAAMPPGGEVAPRMPLWEQSTHLSPEQLACSLENPETCTACE